MTDSLRLAMGVTRMMRMQVVILYWRQRHSYGSAAVTSTVRSAASRMLVKVRTFRVAQNLLSALRFGRSRPPRVCHRFNQNANEEGNAFFSFFNTSSKGEDNRLLGGINGHKWHVNHNFVGINGQILNMAINPTANFPVVAVHTVYFFDDLYFANGNFVQNTIPCHSFELNTSTCRYTWEKYGKWSAKRTPRAMRFRETHAERCSFCSIVQYSNLSGFTRMLLPHFL